MANCARASSVFGRVCRTLAVAFLGLTAFAAGRAEPAAAAPDYAAIVAAPDRSDADRQTDRRRDPERLLAFTGVQPGMKVLDMEAGGGYSAELMARAVGPQGVVYGQNAADSPRFAERAKTPAMRNVIRVVRPFEDPTPPEVRDVDLITFFFFYHDTVHLNVDRAAMNRKLFEALKPGGFLIIADHSARAGDGTSVTKTLHRIEERVLREEVEAAGFRLVDSADFLRNPEDPRNAPVIKPKIPTDEFVLKFRSRAKAQAGFAMSPGTSGGLSAFIGTHRDISQRRRTMAKSTTDHDEIRRWAEKHGGKPAAVKSTHEDGEVGIIRIMFPRAKQSQHDSLEEISWEEFFEKFDEADLVLLYEEDSMFSKLVGRESQAQKAHQSERPGSRH